MSLSKTHQHPSVVGCAVYVDGRRRTEPVHVDNASDVAAEAGGFVWLGLHEPSAEDFADIAAKYGLHALAVEDAVHAHQRPKLERYDDMLFMVLKTAGYVEHDELTATSQIVETGEVMVFLGANYVITVRHGRLSPLRGLRQRLEEQPELLALGPAAVLWGVADGIVDEYVVVADAVEDDVDEVEAQVFSPERGGDNVGRIYQLKRELLELRRAVTPLETPMRTVTERHVNLIPEQMRTYFRDVSDHLARAAEQVLANDELVTSILQAELAKVQVADNADMRRISAWAAIIAVPTMVAGIYGMNFRHMPELGWTFGYPLAVALMVLACVVLYRGFRRNGWL
ncbi:MAG: magnesium/cobalt transporter CorA [Geodermatophilaceae bacterium]|nr:magnesium/cobalt transporter CorA [Geodermatophilaceae bacterium]